MAMIIERIVEAVIEDPVDDIFAKSYKTGAVAGLVPELKLTPVSYHGRAHPSGIAKLPQEQLSDASGLGRSSAPAPDKFSTPLNYGVNAQTGAKGETGLEPAPVAAPSSGFSFPQVVNNQVCGFSADGSEGFSDSAAGNNEDRLSQVHPSPSCFAPLPAQSLSSSTRSIFPRSRGDVTLL